MSGYTKLFSSIIASTIWREDKTTKIVWITMLAMADRYGYVGASIPGLADLARVGVEETREAIGKLESPDPDSRSKADEGRRIRQVDGGWQIVNYMAYRERMNADDRREYNRVRQAELRSRKMSHGVATVASSRTKSAHSREQNSRIAEKHDQSSQPDEPAGARERNPLFDALGDACRTPATQMTAPDARACGVALSQIRKVAPDLTEIEIHRRAENYRLHFREASLTPSALAKHWARCGNAPVATNGDAVPWQRNSHEAGLSEKF